jgi:hypothetical protein
MSYTVELVTFKIFEDSEPGFIEANAAVNDWLKRQPGFISRHLARKTDGGWIDIVLWESKADAKTAADNILPELGGSDAMRAIDPASVSMSHAAIRLSFAA